MIAHRIITATRSSALRCSFRLNPLSSTGDIAGHAAMAMTEANVAATASYAL
jgi:hypothetical protein